MDVAAAEPTTTAAEPTVESVGASSSTSRKLSLRSLRNPAIVIAPWLWFVVRGLHPWMELLAILLPVLTLASTVALVILAAYTRNRVVLALAASLAILYAVAVFVPGRAITSEAPVEPVRFASINLAGQWFSDNEVGFFVIDREPDVFVGIELRTPVDAELRERYENGVSELIDDVPDDEVGTRPDDESYRRAGYPSIGIYSDHPMERLSDPLADTIPGGLPGMRVRVSTDGGDYVVYALHVPRPGRSSGVFEVGLSEQRQLIDAIVDAIDAESLPVVVLGDLNIVDRGTSYQHMTESLTDAMRVGQQASPTRIGGFWHTALRLRIDHLLVSDELCVANARSTRLIYTDHAPVQADVGPCASK